MAKSIAELRQIQVASFPSPGQGLALGPDGKIPASLLAVYKPYVPTWTASGTAPVIGNAVVNARYAQLGKLVHAYGNITFGSTSTFGTGNYAFALPVPALNFNAVSMWVAGPVFLYDNSGDVFAAFDVAIGTATTMKVIYGSGYLTAPSANVGQLAPWTWATSDFIAWNITYEAA